MINSSNKLEREALQELVCNARKEAQAIENDYCKMNEAKKHIVTINDSSLEFSDRLYNLIENLDYAETPWDVIDACNNIDEYIDETIFRGADL